MPGIPDVSEVSTEIFRVAECDKTLLAPTPVPAIPGKRDSHPAVDAMAISVRRVQSKATV